MMFREDDVQLTTNPRNTPTNSTGQSPSREANSSSTTQNIPSVLSALTNPTPYSYPNSHTNTVNVLQTHYFKTHFNIILLTMPSISMFSLSFRLATTTLYVFNFATREPHVPPISSTVI